MVLIGAGRSFIAGADIRGFGTGRKRPPLGERVYDILDASSKPVVAAIHGYAPGGGLEIALACHYRIAVGQREGRPAGAYSIGILPGGGGTAAPAAADRPESRYGHDRYRTPCPCTRSRQSGHYRRGHSGRGRPARQRHRLRAPHRCRAPVAPRSATARIDLLKPNPIPSMFDAMRQSITRRARTSGLRIIALPRWRLHARCRSTTVTAARIGVISRTGELRRGPRPALRLSSPNGEVKLLPDMPAGPAAKLFANAAVIGVRTMGGGIAMSFADFGIPVKIMDSTQEALDRGMARIRCQPMPPPSNAGA